MNKILTVIVPSYNMEALLADDLKSLTIRKNANLLEVLVVNDGSKDKTLDIAKSFADRFPEIFTVIDKPNGNYGSCINAGLKVATGKYIRVMDADDHVDTNAFEAFIDCLKEIDADMVVSNYQKVYACGKREEFTFDFPVGKVSAIPDIYNEDSFSTLLLPALTYRTSILRTMNYRQTEGISYTDMEWCFAPVTQMKTLYYFNQSVYMYVIGRTGQTMDPNIYLKSMPQLFRCLHEIMNSIDYTTLTPWAYRFANEQLAKHAEHVYRFYLVEHPKEERSLLRTFDKELESANPEVYKLCGKIEYRKKIAFHFIEEWRSGRREFIPSSVRTKENVYNFLGTIHYYILKLFNPDLKR